jgi:hypothetical protein
LLNARRADEIAHPLDDRWNIEEANRLVRNTLVEVDALAEQLIPARAEALLDEFERDIKNGFLLRSITVVNATCEQYGRRFRALLPEK